MKDKVEEIIDVAGMDTVENSEVKEVENGAGIEQNEKIDESEKKDVKKRSKFEVLVDDYAKAYPKEKRFYVSSDGQVFFERDKNMAQYHQSGLSEGKLCLIDVER
ncbi:MAG: hypothetical protein ACRDDZ_11165 [Marinifilaceae bacterium]